MLLVTVDSTDFVIPRHSLKGLGQFAKPRDPVQERLVAIWQRILKVTPVGVEDHWYDLGGDSLGAVVLFAEIEAEFHKKVPLGTLLDADTVAKLAAVILLTARKEAAVILNSGGKFPPLFCVHGLHGTAGFAHGIAQHLGPDQPVIGFQERSVLGAEPHESIEAIAAEYLALLREHQYEGPYRLIGWCVGSMIAFEMAQQLMATGEKITHLILIDPPARKPANRYLEEMIRRIENIDASINLRQAITKRMRAISHAARAYEVSPYAGEVVLLCSEEHYGPHAIETSQWRSAARRLVAFKIAPTHLSIVEQYLPRVGVHVRHLLGNQPPGCN